jgi:hypothetical protein
MQMTISTLHARATVVGTRFSLAADDKLTRLEVFSGRVKLDRLADDASGEIAAGEYAIASFDTPPQAKALPPVYITIEAEHAKLVAPMAVHTTTSPPAVTYISSNDPGSGTATFETETTAAGDYVIWCRVCVHSSNNDSFIVCIDNGPEEVYDVAEGKPIMKWLWSQIKTRGSRNMPAEIDPRVYHLESGKRSIVFRSREPFCRLDKIIITNDLKFVPQNESRPVIKDDTSKF